MKTALAFCITIIALSGCTVISEDRVFPKLAPYWSPEAKQQRADNKIHSTSLSILRPPFPPKTCPPDRWLRELEEGKIDIDEYRSLVCGERDLIAMRTACATWKR